jgi:serine/threonine-protein kinase
LLKARQKLDKYKILERIASGPLANVYKAFDTIHKSRVALKIPKPARNITNEDFLREVQVATRLVHPNIITLLNASFIGDYFVIAMELGEESLADRLIRRISTEKALELADQAIAALAYAHRNKVIHCDIKPENYIVFPGNHLKLTDFGFAKISIRTLKASGSGTIDYIAPEQAMGRPKFQSDVFSLGLVLYRMFSGKLPEWPFNWPMIGHERVMARVGPDLAAIIRKAIKLDPADRYKDAVHMYADFRKVKVRGKSSRRIRSTLKARKKTSWRKLRWREFQSQFRKALDTRYDCRRCQGPVSESMQHCPWCGTDNPAPKDDTRMPGVCPRCERGVKSDWAYCAYCYGPGFEVETRRRFADKRYSAKCSNPRCKEPLMPFMRYCPWCRTRVKRPWKLPGSDYKCRSCRSGIAGDFWNYCAWCREPVKRDP